jgi:predicted unusual protein kinase regulating ubiquinone biosynthesis (AarF/ABC1/UbiB family)
VGEQLNQFLNLAGRKHRIYLDPEIMRAIAFLSTVEGVVKELNPTQNFAADVLRVFAKRRR